MTFDFGGMGMPMIRSCEDLQDFSIGGMDKYRENCQDFNWGSLGMELNIFISRILGANGQDYGKISFRAKTFVNRLKMQRNTISYQNSDFVLQRIEKIAN